MFNEWLSVFIFYKGIWINLFILIILQDNTVYLTKITGMYVKPIMRKIFTCEFLQP